MHWIYKRRTQNEHEQKGIPNDLNIANLQGHKLHNLFRMIVHRIQHFSLGLVLSQVEEYTDKKHQLFLQIRLFITLI